MRKASFVVTVSLLAFGCSSDESDNPFAALERTRPIPAWADILFASNLSTPGEDVSRQVFAVSSIDGRLEQLTYPNASYPNRDYCRLAPMSDVDRVVLLERTADPDDPYPFVPSGAAVFLDLARGVKSELVPAANVITGIDASPVSSLAVFSAAGSEGRSDLFWREIGSTNATVQALTRTPEVSERHPRFNRGGNFIIYERIEGESASEIWLLLAVDSGLRITQGGTGDGQLPGTSYRVGSDADPCLSPDGASVVFRRLTSIGDGRHGNWEILVVDSSADSAPTGIATGPAYRGAPDWGPQGIVFTESDPTSERWSLIVVAPDGSDRRTVLAREAPTRIDSPRWIR